jgi:succinate-acetate transporter protein
MADQTRTMTNHQAPRVGDFDGAVPAGVANVFLRPLANPLSLGFLGLFVASAALAAEEVGWVPATQLHHIAIGILVFTVPAQLIACFYGFLTRDTVCATGMGVLAGTWALVGVNVLLSKPGAVSSGLALLLVLGAIAACMPAAGAANAKLLAAIVIFSTAARWGVTAGYEASGSPTWKLAAGAFGLYLAAVALYASLAFELEDQQRRTVLPTLRHKSGAVAIRGPLADQVNRVANEAGVRKQL